MDVTIEPGWKNVLKPYFETDRFKEIATFVREAYLSNKKVYPPASQIFNAFNTTTFEEVSVVIVGQDPYHNPGQAHGLSFSVQEGVAIPPSLLNIYKEINAEFGTSEISRNGDLTRWASQGVLLLNAVLTVYANQPASHAGRGWEEFTDYVIETIANKKEHCVFMLWGNYARTKGKNIDRTKHLVLESAHPSPLSASRGFLGNGHFKKANDYLTAHGKKPIAW